MTGHNLRIYILVQAQLASLEGMRATNQDRERQGYALGYDEMAFAEVAA